MPGSHLHHPSPYLAMDHQPDLWSLLKRHQAGQSPDLRHPVGPQVSLCDAQRPNMHPKEVQEGAGYQCH